MYQNSQQKITTKTITQDNITYLINFEEKKADIISSNLTKGSIITIPHSIKYESTYYVIKNILERSFEGSPVKSIDFSEDSQVVIIEHESFSKSEIESITIPPSLIIIEASAFNNCKNLKILKIPENSRLRSIGNNTFSCSAIESLYIPECLDTLSDQWCSSTPQLQKIIVSPKNPFFCSVNNDMLFKKSYQTQEYDTLIFCNRHIEDVIIPSFIKCIDKLAFNECKRIRSFKFQEDSKLLIIKDDAFASSSIQSIKIPKNLEIINDCAFSYCMELEKIEIPYDSKLHIIGNNAFYKTAIESLFIPEYICDLEYGWCSNTEYLREIEIHPNNKRYKKFNEDLIIGKSSIESDFYDSIIFCNREIVCIEIPSFITIIESNAFENCTFLQNVIIPENSQLSFINDFAFNNSTIRKFTVPSHLIQINPFVFNDCAELEIIEFQKNSELKIIGGNAFAESGITSFSVPPSVIQIDTNIFDQCNNLQIVEFDENSMLLFFDERSFCGCHAIVMVPVSLDYLLNKSEEEEEYYLYNNYNGILI